jgi:type IV pilus assembly protein PilY1
MNKSPEQDNKLSYSSIKEVHMKQASRLSKSISTFVAAAVLWQPLLVTPVMAQPALNPGLLSLFDKPYLSGEEVPPMVMLAVTKDQQLFKKAYDDFSDVDGDGVLDTNYKHTIDYYGYFDPYKCYTYSAGNSRYQPAYVNNDKYCAPSSGQWSGNFLNWASMTRMDALRKVMFGGLRTPNRTTDGGTLADGDTATGTVLERAFLPHDAHSFTKYYAEADLPRLTPFNVNRTLITNAQLMAPSPNAPELRINTLPRVYRVSATANLYNSLIVEAKATTGSYVRGSVANVNTAGGFTTFTLNNITCINTFDVADPKALGCKDATGATGSLQPAANWTIDALNTKGITICNTTDGTGSGNERYSETNPNLPRMKVVQGNHSLWNAMERWQCTWAEKHGAYNGNTFSQSGVPAAGNSPGYSSSLGPNGAVAGDYFVRVQACVNGLFGTERCTRYPNGTYKPTGLLQKYGELGKIYFGLVTGSYKKNLSGGVLRKNIGGLSDEINTSVDGTFKILPNAGVGASPSPGEPIAYQNEGGSIINTLSKMRIVGYDYNDGAYISSDNCSYQRELNTNGECKSWGNPLSEIYFEALRYFSGQTAATPEYVTDDSSIIAGLATAKWPTNSNALLSSRNYCAPLNMLVINGAVTTSENDNDLASKPLNFMAGNPTNAVDATNNVGTLWDLTGNQYFYGNTRSGVGGAAANNCSAKTLGGLGQVLGVCPEGPTTNGSYLIAGLAHHAHTNRIRQDISVARPDSSFKKPPFYLNTYGVSLSAGMPRLPLKFAGEAEPRGYIIPSYILDKGAVKMGGALVDMRITRSYSDATFASGEAMVVFEDSEAGGDYDMDVWGILRYEMDKTANTLTITTDVVYQATGNPQGFGYVVSGTNADGRHFHSGIIGFNYNDPTPGMNVRYADGSVVPNNGGCNGCNFNDAPTTATYTLASGGGNNLLPSGNSNRNLEDPLYYASLFGGFDDANADKKPNKVALTSPLTTSEYDKRNNSTGVDVPDGIPDNYFRVDNPLGLETGLERAFQDISQQSSLSALGVQSTRVTNGTKLFQSSFNSGDWSGSLSAFALKLDGTVGATLWEASGKNLSSALINPNSRSIVTVNDATKAKVAFRWADLSSAQRSALSITQSGSNDGRGEERLGYLRGESTNEGLGALQFRQRLNTKLGDIVASSPVFVGSPASGFSGTDYLSFYNARKNRQGMVYVGANDGMVHGFNADNGNELFAYIPSMVIPNLSRLTAQDYSHRFYVDGLMTQQDARLNGQWGTYVAGALGKGGQGVYLLDVTDPNRFSSEATAKDVVKWEFTHKDDNDMGYVYTEPVIRQMENNKWAMIFSAGYNATENDGRVNTTGTAGRGAIFIVYLDGPGADGVWEEGVDYVKLLSGEGSATNPNGFGGVATIDNGADGKVNYLYSGDLFGNIWRFNVSGASSAWSNSSQRFKLFTATSASGQRQSITAAPQVISGPANQGVVVTFGTGRLLERTDVDPGAYIQNSMYGLWDKPTALDGSILRSTLISKNDLMLQRMIATEDNSAVSATTAALKFSLLSAYVPNYSTANRTNTIFGTTNPDATAPTATTPPQLGWMFEQPAIAGERTVYQPQIAGSLGVYVNIIPSADTCGGGGSEAQYILDLYTGGRNPFGGFDRDSNGKFQSNAAGGKDQSTFGLTTPNNKKYNSSRRESTGGFGQLTIITSGGNGGGAGGGGGGGGGGDTGSSSSCSQNRAIKSMTDKSISNDGIGSRCVGRQAWREVLLAR